MTAPMEFEIEAEPIAASHLLAVPCVRRCGARTVAAPGQERAALCGPCRLREASGVAAIQRLPTVPPPPLGWDRPDGSGATEAVSAPAVQDPEMVCPAYCEHERPGPVRGLVEHAGSYGWHLEVRHSRGGVMGGSGKQLAVADMWSVRFRRGPWKGYAARRGEDWDSVCVAGEALPPFLMLGLVQLREWLTQPDRPAAWYDAVRALRAQQELDKKIVKCPGPGVCDVQGPWSLDGVLVPPSGPDHTHRASGAIRIKISKKEKASGL